MKGITKAAVLSALVLLATGCVAERQDFSGYGCQDLADEITTASRGEYLQIENVRDVSLKHDYRTSYDPPSGENRAEVLRCTGTADWSWDETAPVVLEMSVDTEGKTWLNWEPTL